jgi:hypothetical protein
LPRSLIGDGRSSHTALKRSEGNVRFGSKADITVGDQKVRLVPIADIGIGERNVCFGHERTSTVTAILASTKINGRRNGWIGHS